LISFNDSFSSYFEVDSITLFILISVFLNLGI